MKRKLPTGIFRTPTGYRAIQWVPDPRYPRGRFVSRSYKADASLEDMKRWREDQRVRARAQQTLRDADQPPVSGGFVGDAERYLNAVQAMPTYRERRRHIQEWALLFGDRPRDEITAVDIRAQRDRWLTTGPRMVQERGPDGKVVWIAKPLPLSASSVNHRLRALENLWTVLDGRHAPNPVRDVPEAIPPDPEPRGETFSLALEILSFMPDVTRPLKGGAVEPGSLSRVRFEAMLMTGLTPKQLAALKPEHVDWTVPAFVAPRRYKGRTSRRQRAGRPMKPRPLMPEAVAALRSGLLA